MREFVRGLAAVCCGVVLGLTGTNADAALTRSSAEKMMASGKSMACDYQLTDDNGEQSGTVYFSQGKMRGDFDVNDSAEGSYQGHMIRDGSGWAYMWGGPMGGSQGTKMRIDANAASAKKSKGFDTSEEVDMDCREWSADASKFVPPSNVEFTDMSQMMGQMRAAMGSVDGVRGADGTTGFDMQAMKCQACDQVPAGPDRDQCRQMMGCS